MVSWSSSKKNIWTEIFNPLADLGGACPAHAPLQSWNECFQWISGHILWPKWNQKKHDEVHLKVKTFQISMTMANIYFYRFFKCNKTPEIDCVLGTTSRVYSSGYFAFVPRLNWVLSLGNISVFLGHAAHWLLPGPFGWVGWEKTLSLWVGLPLLKSSSRTLSGVFVW